MAGVEERLLAVSPIDGRYADKAEELSPIASEFGLIHRRLGAMAGYFVHLQSGVLPDVPTVSASARGFVDELVSDFSVSQAAEVKAIERETNHDVKAVEVWLRRQIAKVPELVDNQELIHFGCTSEDVNSVAYGRMFNDLLDVYVSGPIARVGDDLDEKADAWKAVPMLSLTHGQPATPSTVGKEIAVFRSRLDAHTSRINGLHVFAKWSGATGNYAAANTAYPEVDWRTVNKQFLEKMGVRALEPTTQIEPHDYMAQIFNELSLGNIAKTDLAWDMWGYISRGVFAQKPKAGEVGSSTMPHKVNPIDFENAISNLGNANATAKWLAEKLPVSRFQRDLSDSAALRSTGEVFAKTIIADKAILRGLGKITLNEPAIKTELDQNWAVLTEAVQTVMRRYKIEGAYDIIKAASRGKEFDKDTYSEIVEKLNVPVEAKDRLRQLQPSTYTGVSEELAT